MSFISYLKDTKAELKHVAWPSRNQVIFSTIGVIIVSGVVAYFLGLFDVVFAKILGSLLK